MFFFWQVILCAGDTTGSVVQALDQTSLDFRRMVASSAHIRTRYTLYCKLNPHIDATLPFPLFLLSTLTVMITYSTYTYLL